MESEKSPNKKNQQPNKPKLKKQPFVKMIDKGTMTVKRCKALKNLKYNLNGTSVDEENTIERFHGTTGSDQEDNLLSSDSPQVQNATATKQKTPKRAHTNSSSLSDEVNAAENERKRSESEETSSLDAALTNKTDLAQLSGSDFSDVSTDMSEFNRAEAGVMDPTKMHNMPSLSQESVVISSEEIDTFEAGKQATGDNEDTLRQGNEVNDGVRVGKSSEEIETFEVSNQATMDNKDTVILGNAVSCGVRAGESNEEIAGENAAPENDCRNKSDDAVLSVSPHSQSCYHSNVSFEPFHEDSYTDYESSSDNPPSSVPNSSATPESEKLRLSDSSSPNGYVNNKESPCPYTSGRASEKKHSPVNVDGDRRFSSNVDGDNENERNPTKAKNNHEKIHGLSRTQESRDKMSQQNNMPNSGTDLKPAADAIEMFAGCVSPWGEPHGDVEIPPGFFRMKPTTINQKSDTGNGKKDENVPPFIEYINTSSRPDRYNLLNFLDERLKVPTSYTPELHQEYNVYPFFPVYQRSSIESAPGTSSVRVVPTTPGGPYVTVNVVSFPPEDFVPNITSLRSASPNRRRVYDDSFEMTQQQNVMMSRLANQMPRPAGLPSGTGGENNVNIADGLDRRDNFNEPDRPTGRRMPAVICYICGRNYGTASIDIHQKKCLEKWRTENNRLPKKERRPEPVNPNIAPPEREDASAGSVAEAGNGKTALVPGSGTGNYNLDNIDGTPPSSQHRAECEKCGRSFLSDRLGMHMKNCRGFHKIVK